MYSKADKRNCDTDAVCAKKNPWASPAKGHFESSTDHPLLNCGSYECRHQEWRGPCDGVERPNAQDSIDDLARKKPQRWYQHHSGCGRHCIHHHLDNGTPFPPQAKTAETHSGHSTISPAVIGITLRSRWFQHPRRPNHIGIRRNKGKNVANGHYAAGLVERRLATRKHKPNITSVKTPSTAKLVPSGRLLATAPGYSSMRSASVP